MDLEALLNTKIGSFSLGDLLSALLTFVICYIVIRLLEKLVRRALEKSRMSIAMRAFTVSASKVALWIVAILIIADTLGIPSATLVASLSVVGLALSLSLQSILSNVFSGFTILMTKPFASGDFVEIGANSGVVTAIGLFYTTLVSPDKKEIHIPNGDVSASRVINYSHEPNRRVDLTFGLDYGCSAGKVRDALLDTARSDGRVLDDPAPEVVLSQYDASNVKYILRAWVKTPDYWDAYFALNELARENLEKAGLFMAYDHMDVRIINGKGENG